MKTCSKCTQAKPVAEFNKSVGFKDGKYSWCKECKRHYDRKRWLERREEPGFKQNKAEYDKHYNRDVRFKNPKNRIKRALRCRLYQAIIHKYRSQRTKDLLGCEWKQFMEHLESQFQKGMSFENYGKWHVDHIRPVNTFDLNKEEEVKRCFHYTNLRPLWAHDNQTRPHTG